MCYARANLSIQKMGAEGKNAKAICSRDRLWRGRPYDHCNLRLRRQLTLLVGSARLRQIYSRAHPASVLAYVRQSSPASAVVKELELRRDLKQAGYRSYAVENTTKLDSALTTGQFDLVLADVSDAEGLEEQVRSAPSMPLMLPIVYKSNKTETAVAEKSRELSP